MKTWSITGALRSFGATARKLADVADLRVSKNHIEFGIAPRHASKALDQL
jgi:hypothetical protein